MTSIKPRGLHEEIGVSLVGMERERIAVVMAGGSGERFWPVSRAGRPKQLLTLTHPSKNLLQQAVERVEAVVDQVWVATSLPLLEPIRFSALVPPAQVLGEPARRNTLGGLVWVVANLVARFPENWTTISLAVVTADHDIGDTERFQAVVTEALDLAESTGGLVTIGIKPTRADTGFGYIETEGEGPGRAHAFKEKPGPATAQSYFESGRYLWNSGMFFWTLEAFVRELTVAQPTAAEILQEIAAALAADSQEEAAIAFEKLTSISVDYALMEQSTNVYVVPGDFPWDDVGSWDALERSFPQDESGNTIIGEAQVLSSRGTIVFNEDSSKKVGILGVDDLVVVVTHDSVLVCPKENVQQVRQIAMLFEKGH